MKAYAMNFKTPGIYHIYNRGNNQQPIFFSNENYLYFLRKCQFYIKPCADIICWCLMPTHFHFLLSVTEKSLLPVQAGGISMPAITNAFRLLQSSYAKGINTQQGKSGSLFQQKAKSKLVSGEEDYTEIVFNYIHYNAVMSGLVKYPEDWPFSSYPDYIGSRNGSLCNKELGFKLLHLNEDRIKVADTSRLDFSKLKYLIG